MHGLRHSAGFVQSKLAKRLETRFTPVIQFVLDQGVKKSIEMTRLLNEALAKSPSPEASATAGEGAGAADGTADEDAADSEPTTTRRSENAD